MNNMKAVMAVILAAIFSISAVVPVSATRYFDPNSNTWVDSSTTFRGGSPIPKATIDYETNYSPGTIIIETSERRLYFILEDGKAIRYGIGVGRDGFRWSGSHRITRKAEWPGWTPPPAMRRRIPDLPAYMEGGPTNPLGARALYIGSTLYRIHGTAEPWTIGQAVSSGCIRLTNDDVIDLYERVRVGARVIVRQ